MALSASDLFRATTEWVPCLSFGSNVAPGAPAVDDRHIVGPAPVGVWAGQANSLARWDGAVWVFSAPSATTTGWAAYVAGTGLYGWSGAAWSLVLLDPPAHAPTHAPATGTDPLATAIAGTIAVGDAAAVGVADNLSRSDHKHALPAPALPASQGTGAGTAGVSTSVAREDHVHPMVAQAPAAHAPTHAPATGTDPLATAIAGTIAVGDAAAVGVADSLSRSDHQHALPAPAAPADVTKAAASAGVATTVARADHKHDISTAVPGASIDIGDAAAEGVATSLARSDHQHAVPAPGAAPPAIDAAGATGVATTPARSDHTHAHGSQALGAGTDHALVTVAVAGFMSAADKTKLNGLPASASDRAMIFFGGASMGAGDTGKHFGAQEGSNGGKTAALSSDNQMSCGIAGTVSLLTWNSVTADGTTVFKINKNGLVVATLTLTGVSGSIAVVGVTSALGDLFAVEYDAGTSPGRTTVQVWAYA